MTEEKSKNKGEEYYGRAYPSKDIFEIKYPVLDLGGSSGNFLKWIGISKATILDMDYIESGDFNFIQHNFDNRIDLPEKYKTIFIMETLEHIKKPLYVLSQIHELLDDAGKCYLSVPYTPLGDEHINRWEQKELEMQLRMLGFYYRCIHKRRRFKNTAFWLPHCFLVYEIWR
jgi:2-polyprenyl-3-methyl-5-hydroxy-6-metoxy-1,4-benzoquinol methylase